MKEYIFKIQFEEVQQDNIPWAVIVAIIIYIISVAVMIIDAKRKSIGTLIWDPKNEEYSDLKVFKFGEVEKDGQTILLKSDHNLYNVTLYKLDVDTLKKDKRSKDVLRKILTPKECVVLATMFTECIPHQAIEFENEAFMKCSIMIEYNGRVGDVTLTENYKLTGKSMLYFLLLGLVNYKG